MSALSVVRRAGHSTTLEAMTRAGFVGYGLLHLAVAWLALEIALGHRAATGDQSGAFRLLARQPLGRPLLWCIIVGLAAMAVWQLTLAIAGHRSERHRTFERVVSVGRVVVYVGLAWTAYRVAAGAVVSSAGEQQAATAGVLAHPAGRLLVTIAGLAVVGLGIGMAVYGIRRAFVPKLNTGRMSWPMRQLAVQLGRAGYIAKGVAFAIVGLLLIQAAVTYDASRSSGLDGALRTLAAKPFGVVLLALVALGFAAFGAYCFVQSKYRKV